MNVRLKKTFAAPAIVVDHERYESAMINQYDITLHVTVTAENPEEINIAYERINYWVSEIFSNSVLISQDSDKIASWESTGQRYIVFPDQPVDQLVGIMLFHKLNAITEGRLDIAEIEISSGLDDYVVYLHARNEISHGIEIPSWWMESDPTWYSTAPRPKRGSKVISINRKRDWGELDLKWDSDNNEDSGVLIGKFTYDDDDK